MNKGQYFHKSSTSFFHNHIFTKSFNILNDAGDSLFIRTHSIHSLSNIYLSYLDKLNIFNAQYAEFHHNCFNASTHHSFNNFQYTVSSSSHLILFIKSVTIEDINDITITALTHHIVATFAAVYLLCHNTC